MPTYQEYGMQTRVTGTGTIAITSANSALIGILCYSSGTCAVQLFAGVTTASSLSGIIRFNVTVLSTIPAAIYLPFPAYCSGGFTVKVSPAADPDLTLFWNPVGGA